MKHAFFDLKKIRTPDLEPIRPEEHIISYLDRCTKPGCDEARRYWNRCLSCLPISHWNSIAPRLSTRNKNNAQVLETFTEISTLDALRFHGICAIPINDTGCHDLYVPSELGTTFIEVKSKNPSSDRQFSHDQLHSLLYYASKHVTNRRVRLHIHSFTPAADGSPSARSLASFLNKHDAKFADKNNLYEKNEIHWTDSATCAKLCFSIIYANSDPGYATLDGIGPCEVEWLQSENKMMSVLDFIRSQHRNRKYTIPAIRWNDWLHEPDVSEIRNASSLTPHGLVWITGGTPWSSTKLKFYPSSDYIPAPYDKIASIVD